MLLATAESATTTITLASTVCVASVAAVLGSADWQVGAPGAPHMFTHGCLAMAGHEASS